MKIKFLKPFRFIGNAPDDGSDSEVPVGHVVDLENDESAQWLIDNGFAKEVKESGWWKPKYGEEYFYVGLAGSAHSCIWTNDGVDNGRLKLGFVFKTEEAAIHCRDYLIAVATVRQDEGVLMPEEAAKNRYNYYIWIHDEFGLEVHGFNADYVSVNTVLFDTREHAQASLDEHPDEWKTIVNYDWSRE